MVLDFPSWESQLYTYLDVDPPEPIRTQVADLANFDVPSEDVTQHKRQVVPGDHKRKLKPATIEEMNTILAEHLTQYGYL